MNLVGHYLQEIAVCDIFLIGTDVDVWSVGEYCYYLFKNGLEGCYTIVGLHIISHCTHESLAVAGHINLGDYNDTALLGIVL